MNFFQFASSARQQAPVKRPFAGLGIGQKSFAQTEASPILTRSPQIVPKIQLPQESPQQEMQTTSRLFDQSKPIDINKALEEVDNELKIFTIWANQQEAFISKLIDDATALEQSIDRRIETFT